MSRVASQSTAGCRSLGAVFGSVLALSTWLLPAVAWAEEPTEPPANYRPERYPPPGTGTSLVLAGAGVALGGYAMAFGTSYLWPDAPTAKDLRIPVAGPILAIAGAKCGDGELGCGTVPLVFRTIFAAVSGVGQLGGLLILGEGLWLRTGAAAPQNAVVYGHLARTPAGSEPAYSSGLSAPGSAPAAATDLERSVEISPTAVQPTAAQQDSASSWFFSPVASDTGFGLSVVGAF